MNLGEKLTGRSGYGQYYQRLRLRLDQPQTKVIGLASLTIFTVIFFIIFAILPTFKTIASLAKEIDDARTVEAKLQQKIHSLNQADTLYSEVAPRLAILDQLVPPQPEFERLAWQLHWLAEQNQVTLINGSFGDFPIIGQGNSKNGELAPISVSLSATGNYQAIKNFLADLHRLDRLIQTGELTITSKTVRAAGDPLTAGIKLTAFYLPRL